MDSVKGLPQATLRQLSEAGLVERAVIDDYPPRTRYQLGRRARRWVPDLERLGAAGA